MEKWHNDWLKPQSAKVLEGKLISLMCFMGIIIIKGVWWALLAKSTFWASTAQQRSRPLWALTRWDDLQTPTPQLKRLRSVEITTEIDPYLQQIALHYVIHYLRRGVWDKVRLKKMSIWLFIPLKAIESLPSLIDWAERKRIFQLQKMFWSFIHHFAIEWNMLSNMY